MIMRSIVAACALAAFSDMAMAQCSASATNFCVKQAAKTGANPNPGGFTCCAFYINDTEGLEVTLVRGKTYTFTMVNVPATHPFYISTNDVGGGTGVWTLGVTPPGGGVTGNNVLTFAVPSSAPDLLYYQCKNHQRMGWKINIVDPCPADFDGSGFVDFDDFNAFVDTFILGDISADFDGSGFVDFDDFNSFVAAFETGC